MVVVPRTGIVAAWSRFRPAQGRALRWGAIWGAVFVAGGVCVLLDVLGMALGFAVLDPFRTGRWKDFGMCAAVWATLVQIVALFAGGIVAARQAGRADRFTAVLHAVVLWGFVTVGSAAVALALFGSVVDALAHILHAEGTPSPAKGARPSLRVDSSALIELAGDPLVAAGRPDIAPGALDAHVRAAADRARQEGPLDPALVVPSFAEHTALSRADATAVSVRIDREVGLTQREGGGALEQALAAARAAAWAAFLASLLGLVGALAGATVGVMTRAVARTDRRRTSASAIEDATAPLRAASEVDPRLG